MDVAGKGEIKSVVDCRFWDNGGIGIVGGGVNLVVAGKGVGRGNFGTWENLPDNIKVL